MHKSDQSIAAIAVVAALGAASPANAQQHPAALGDLMTALVQPRHIKLGLAGSQQNWPYAAYELNQLRATFADVAEILPKYRDLSIPDMITSTVKEPLAALDRAIQAKDSNQFNAAYGQLTASCNACHESYDRAAIVMQPPTGTIFPDQDFRPPTK
jgi:Cytochrome C'